MAGMTLIALRLTMVTIGLSFYGEKLYYSSLYICTCQLEIIKKLLSKH